MTVTQAQTLLSSYVGANYTFLDRLNLVRQVLLQQGNWPDTIRVIEIAVTTDTATGFDVIVLPSTYETILAVAPKPDDVDVPCGCIPMGVRNVYDWFNSNALGYGARTYAAQELAPDPGDPTSKRYQVPTDSDDGYSYICLVKLKYAALTQGTDVVYPDNIAALKTGLRALNAEDSDNDGLADELWAKARALLSEESENKTGAGATGRVDVPDDLDLECIGRGL